MSKVVKKVTGFLGKVVGVGKNMEPPTPPPPAEKKEEEEVKRRAAGRASTVLTGNRGLMADGTESRRVLLGS